MSNREGFSLIEVIVAMVILAIGILSMGASTGYVLTQVRAAELRTDRMVAVRQVSETLRALSWDDLPFACSGSTFTSGPFTVSCTIHAVPGAIDLRRVELISVGPGVQGRQVRTAIVDTTAIGIARPVQ